MRISFYEEEVDYLFDSLVRLRREADERGDTAEFRMLMALVKRLEGKTPGPDDSDHAEVLMFTGQIAPPECRAHGTPMTLLRSPQGPYFRCQRKKQDGSWCRYCEYPRHPL